MFSHSQSQTPIPVQPQYHEKLADTVTWIKDWYIPQLPSTSESIPQSVRLKGWFKTNENHKSSKFKFSNDDILDLSHWKYAKESIKIEPVVATENPPELKSALAMETD